MYEIPVDSGHASAFFAIDIAPDHIRVLEQDIWRRISLQHILHTLLQHEMMTGRAPDMVHMRQTLHTVLLGTDDEVNALIDAVGRTHHVALARLIAADVSAHEA